MTDWPQQVSNAGAKIDLELRFGESSLLWGASSKSDADSDADICAVSELPKNIEVPLLFWTGISAEPYTGCYLL